jgi:hypothetical protein
MTTARTKGPAPKNRPYDVGHYRIELDIDEATGRFAGKVAIRLTPASALREIALDCVGLGVLSARLLPDTPLAWILRADPAKPDDGTLTLSFSEPLPKRKEATIEIAYTGHATPTQAGLFWVTDPDDPERGRIYATQFESIHARRMFPSNDEPYDRATTEMIVTVGADLDVVSNGHPVVDEKIDAGRRHRVHWVMDKPQPPYLAALAVGRFTRLDVPGTKLTFYVDPRKVDRAEYLKRSTQHAMEFQEKFVGVTYPWDSYAQVSLPTFRWGGMENTGCTIEKASAILPDDPTSERVKVRIQGLVAHELAHQWFGDYVTMAWWDDLWLNESFASYLQQLTSEDFFQDEGEAIRTLVATHTQYFRQEGGPLAHPIVQTELPSPEDAFDPITYTKGQNVLQMLDAHIGRQAFRDGIRNYLTQFALRNAATADFFASMQKTSGRKLDAFQKAWLYKRGYPVMSVRNDFDAKKGVARLQVRQRSLMNDGTLFPFRLPVSLHRRSDPAYDVDISMEVAGAATNATAKVPAEPEWVTWNAGGVVLGRVEKRSDGEAGWILQAKQDPDPVSRFTALVELASPLLDRSLKEPGLLTQRAAEAIDVVLRTDKSVFVRAGLIALLSSMPWRRLPEELAGAVAACAASSPAGAPPIGVSWLRGMALACLGKFGTPEAREIAARELANPKLPLDDLGPAARGMAEFGDESALQAMDRALDLHASRGYAYRVAVAMGYCAFGIEQAVPRIRKTFQSAGSDADQLLKLQLQLADNTLLLSTDAGAQLARDLTEWPAASESFRADAVGLFEEVRTPAAKEALQTIAGGASTERLRQLARRILEKNFLRKKTRSQ